MNQLLKVYFAGLLISLIGSLPFGILNVTAFSISNEIGIQNAFGFASGVILIEVIYLWITLYCSQWIHQQPWLHKLNSLSVLMLAFMVVSCFWSIFSDAPPPQMLRTTSGNFILGISLSAINPFQIPFWLGWNAVLFSKNVLHHNRKHYQYYMLGVGTGTFIGLTAFIISGWLIKGNMIFNHTFINAGIGIMYLICMIIQLVKSSQHKSAF